MCMLLHRYTVFVILFANGTPFYNSGSVFDHIAVSIYALQCYMYLWWTVSTICIVVELLFLYNGGVLFLCVVVQDEPYTVIPLLPTRVNFTFTIYMIHLWHSHRMP